MIPTNEHITGFLGHTILGSIINMTLAGIMLLLQVWDKAKEIGDGLSLIIQLASIVVLYFSIKNGYMAMKKNQADLNKINEQRDDSNN